MRKLLSLAVLLSVFTLSGIATQNCYGWGTATGDGSDYRQLQETAIFFNNSGSTLSEGDVVVLDVDGSGVTTGTTLGSYVTTTADEDDSGHYGADSVLVVGVVKSSSVANQRPIAVVTKGPALTTCEDSTDAVTEFASVGTVALTSNEASCGGGSNLGIALEGGDGTDDDQIIVWVDATGAD
jgi:hypothetical protein